MNEGVDPRDRVNVADMYGHAVNQARLVWVVWFAL